MKKILWNKLILISSILTLILVFNIKVFGEERTFNCTVVGHYKNPLTGVVEDSGGEKSLTTGQGMVSGAVKSKGKLTVKDGKYYLNFALSLAEFSSGHDFLYADTGTKAPCSLVGHGKDDNGKTNKYRAELKGEDTVLKISMYVEPMGRNVIFFVTVSNLKEIGTSKATDKKAVNQQEQLQPQQGQAVQPQMSQAQMSQVQIPQQAPQGQTAQPQIPQAPQGQILPDPYSGLNGTQSGGYGMPPMTGYAIPQVPNGYAMPVMPGYAMPQLPNGYGMPPMTGYGMYSNGGMSPNAYSMNPGAYTATIPNPMELNPDLTAADPSLEFNNSYNEANSDKEKGLVLSTDKEVEEEKGQGRAKAKISFNKEILPFFLIGAAVFVLCFGITLGLGYLKKTKRE